MGMEEAGRPPGNLGWEYWAGILGSNIGWEYRAGILGRNIRWEYWREGRPPLPR